MTREEVIQRLEVDERPTLSRVSVIKWLKELDDTPNKGNKPTSKNVYFGDIFIGRIGLGKKNRPFLVISKNKNDVLGVAMTTTKDERYLCDAKGRWEQFSSEGGCYIGSDIRLFTYDYVRENTINNYGNKSHVTEIRRMVKERYSKVLR